MKLSVIIPVYNVEQYLDECVGSILSQKFTDYEILLVNDGSEDSSPAICDRYAEEYDFIRAIHQENSGPSAARNNGITESRGEYLMFLDSDDILLGDEMLGRIAGCIDSLDPDAVLIGEDEYDTDFKEIYRRHGVSDWEENRLYKSSEVIDGIYGNKQIWSTQAVTKIVRRSFIFDKDLMFTGGIYHEDDDWSARLFFSDPTLCFIKDPVYGYRRRPGSIMSASKNKMIFRKRCDKVRVGAMMLSFPQAKRYKRYMRYTADYFSVAVAASNGMGEELKEEFIRFVSGYRKYFLKYIHTGDLKQIIKGLLIFVFGVRAYVKHYDRVVGADREKG